MSDILILQIAFIAASTVAFAVSLQFLTRFLERKRLAQTPSRDVLALHQRLERIEQVVESTAIEVERIAEANRFMSKILVDRANVAIPRATQPERVITPH